MPLVQKVKKFLESNWDRTSPLLLGYSGGPDSKGLLYALLEAGATSLHLAHVDHAWRPESAAEAARLADEAARLNLPFHSIRLNEKPHGNLEELGRLARLRFFRSLFDTTGFAALLLAHHSDDAAETSLKRLFEGAHLTNFGGMSEQSAIDGMPIWRPLLDVSKQTILQYLSTKQLTPLVDSTNEDPRFLRTRVRQGIIPSLEQSFGKNIHSNLRWLSERSTELKEYLDRMVRPLWDGRLEGPWGICLALRGVERVVARHALLTLLAQEQLVISRALLETWLSAVQDGFADVCFETGGRTLYADRGRVFLLAQKMPRFADPIPVRAGQFTSGDWTVDIRTPSPSPKQGWQQVWTGHFEIDLPDGTLQLPDPGSMWQEEWRAAGVPAFFRRQALVVTTANKTFEFLTARPLNPEETRWTARFSVSTTP